MKNKNSLSLRFENNQLFILDQQLLPHREVWIAVESPDHMISIIKALKVRGAPLIGVAAAFALANFAPHAKSPQDFLMTAQKLKEARPTAVNLMNAIDRMVLVAKESDYNSAAILQKAMGLYDEDVDLCERMAQTGAELIQHGDNVLTHCNTGGLATVGVGTALGAILKAHHQGKNIHVYVDETRPLLQGGRLTTWELEKAGVPYTLICDNMSGVLMRAQKVQRVLVGADRIALNGDFANKIGTYNLAVLCSHHQVPFYTVAPQTTVDPECAHGGMIPVEEREDHEVRGVSGDFGQVIWSPSQAPTFNPAFDVTPVSLLTGIVLDGAYFSRSALQSGELKKLKMNS